MERKRDSWLHLERAGRYAVGAGYWLHRYHPNRRRVTVFIAFLVALLVAALSFRVGWWYNGYRFETQEQALGSLRIEVEQLRRERDELRVRLAHEERSAAVATRASSELNTTLASLEVEVMELKRELGFYKGLVTPVASKRQIRLNEVLIEPSKEPRNFRYQITLTQVLGRGKRADGEVELRLEGRRGGKKASVSLARLSSGKVIPFSFKYFQRLTGDLILPENFKPARVRIQIRPRTRGLEKVQESLVWADALSGGAS